ncbi:MAG: hypothetical protein D6761_11415, partial [Candidatus Dadabacteria bacterium]
MKISRTSDLVLRAFGLALMVTACLPDGLTTQSCLATADCPDGQVCRIDEQGKGQCAVPLTCDDLACGEQFRLCAQPEGVADAFCAEICELGYAWNETASTCDPAPASCDPDHELSIVDRCEAANRTCVEAEPLKAICGDCGDGFVEGSDGQCVAAGSCEALGCGAIHRACPVSTPAETCGECLPGYAADGDGNCISQLTCEDLTCNPGETCVEAVPGAHAYCVGAGSQCEVLDFVGLIDTKGVCRLCGSCDREGEDGPYLDALSSEGKCICKTKPGYYWEQGLAPRAVACDADGDGWVTERARKSLDAPAGSAIRENARCDLRQVDEIQLVNDANQSKLVVLPKVLSLYEPDRNDDPALLQQAIDRGELVDLGLPATEAAASINTLTRFCIDPSVDYNGNGIPDIQDWHGNYELDTVSSTLRDWNDWSYYAELHYSYFVNNGVTVGRLVIAERRRATLLPVRYEDPGDGYWAVCRRRPDVDYTRYAGSSTPLYGLDFARFGPDSAWNGMGHHSQFKCIQIVQQRTGSDPYYKQDRQSIGPRPDGEALDLNRCSVFDAIPAPGAPSGAANPLMPVYTCNLETDPQPGSVYLAAVQYRDTKTRYEASKLINGTTEVTLEPAYTRGCISECGFESLLPPDERCPGYNTNRDFDLSFCTVNPRTFGRIACGCSTLAAGSNCEIGCTPLERMQSANMNDAARVACRSGACPANLTEDMYWLCGDKAQAEDTRMCQYPAECSDPAGPTTGYEVRGDLSYP